MHGFTRRLALKILGLGSAALGLRRPAMALASAPADLSAKTIDWSQTHDRVWLGGNVWANPMEDWSVTQGAAECQSTGGNRSVHRLTHQIAHPQKGFSVSVEVACVERGTDDGGAGFRIGILSDIQEYRSSCFVDSGIRGGWVGEELRLGPKTVPMPSSRSIESMVLRLEGHAEENEVALVLTATSPRGEELAKVSHRVPTDDVLGNVAIVNNLFNEARQQKGSRYRFQRWTFEGAAFDVDSARAFGPILWTMYSLSDSRTQDGFVLKLSALTGPLGEKDNQEIELEIERDGTWRSIAMAALDRDAWTATFRIPNWNEKVATSFRVVYREFHRDGKSTRHEWTGTIRANPEGRPLRLGALTCQNDYGFPYEPVAKNLLRLDPDLLYFSGDQIYENHGGFGIIRDPAEPAILNYLRKFYQFGWAFRDAMRDRPTLCIPDDHDVFQGNIWGEGGKPMPNNDASSHGGYREPARMVNVVHKTNAAHHPDYFDPTPVEQGISVYYGDMVYGGVGFAILGDRQFKSGPQHVDTRGPRADHVADPDFDTSTLDKPGLVLLGERQEKFLEHWVQDWRGHSMKVLLSQTVFSGAATHHGRFNGYLKADLDSGGWPQTPRNRAIEIIRQGRPLHVNGDQHLASLLQYGVSQQRDSCWSFCTPAISVGYPRWWRPDELGMPVANRPSHNLANTGEYLDGLGNKMYIYAIGNPEVASLKNRYELAHQKGSGFGLVTIDTRKKTYLIEAFRFLVDATDGKTSNQFPGWPVTIHQEENGGKNRLK